MPGDPTLALHNVHDDIAGPIETVLDADGAILYLIPVSPEALPPVTGRELSRAWDAARMAARNSCWGVARGFRFRRADGSHLDLAISDRDARSWAGAVDGISRMQTRYGLSLCLRLLALIDLLSHAPWTASLLSVRAGTVELHPALLSAAASVSLTPDARFDMDRVRARLSQDASAVAGGI